MSANVILGLLYRHFRFKYTRIALAHHIILVELYAEIQ